MEEYIGLVYIVVDAVCLHLSWISDRNLRMLLWEFLGKSYRGEIRFCKLIKICSYMERVQT